MFEHHREPLLSSSAFLRRLILNFALSAAVIAFSLSIGVFGYHCLEGLSWLDSLLNASMILSGMGPVQELRHSGSKLFASFYALFSGVAFISTVGILFAPIVHRALHKFHVELEDQRGPRK